MAGNRGYGNIEWGTLLDEKDHSIQLGRIALDAGSQKFWLRPSTSQQAQQIPWQNVAHYLAVGAILFDAPSNEKKLIAYLQRLEDTEKEQQRLAREKRRGENVIKKYEEDKTILKKTRFRSRMAKFFWTIACLTAIAVTFIVTIPPDAPASQLPTIAGYGADYGINPEELKKASYIEALGSASELYGVIVDQDIVEVGVAATGESTIKENVMLSPQISSQPIHMRPLYYDKSSFYQSSLVVNDSDGGMTAAYLQNPKGYSHGYAANDLVLTGGAGISAITIASPDQDLAMSAEDAQSLIEEQQEAALDDDNDMGDIERQATLPAEGFYGFDSCDIDDTWVAASYRYERPAMFVSGDNQNARRVIIYDVAQVVAKGSEGRSNMNSVNLNYQDQESDYYAPVVSKSRETNGSIHWLGYMKRDPSGGTGFFVRKIAQTTDILMETNETTFSSEDITGSTAPISNYVLDGDYLFFEQAGSIWMSDLAPLEKKKVTIDSTKFQLTRNNPTEICKTSEMQTFNTRDEEFIAKQTHETLRPVAHYRVMKITTSQGLQYGIVFMEASTGNLVFQPCNDIVIATSATGDSSTENSASHVQDQNQAEIDRLKREDEETGEYAEDYDRTEAERQKQEAQQKQEEERRASGVAASTNGRVARPWQGGDSSAAHAWKAADGMTISRVIVGLAERPDEKVSIIAFTIRGEQLIWLEEDMSSHQRCVRISPVYYKNEAMKIQEQTSAFAGETELSGTEQQEQAQQQRDQEQRAQQQRAQQQSGATDAAAQADAATSGVPQDGTVMPQDGQMATDPSAQANAVPQANDAATSVPQPSVPGTPGMTVPETPSAEDTQQPADATTPPASSFAPVA